MYKRILKNRNYMYLQIANCINRIGDSIDAIALSWLAYAVSESAAISAINYAINFCPTVFLQPLMGAYIAKRDKKRIMFIADIIRFVIIGVLAYKVYDNSVTTSWILVSTALMSCVETLRQPASSTIIPLIVEKDDYQEAISFSSSVNRISELIGSALSGVIISVFGVYAAILTDAISFLLSGLLIGMIHTKEVISNSIKQSSFFTNLKQGFKYTLSNRALLLITIIAAFANLILIPFNSLQSVLISDVYSGNVMLLSLISVALSLGGILGGVIYPKASHMFKTKFIMLSVFVITGLYYCLLIVASYMNILVIIFVISISSFIIGIVTSVASCHITTLVMVRCDQQYLSRVASLFGAISAAFIPLGSLVVAILSNFMEVKILFIVVGATIALSSIMASKSKTLEVINE